jgi:hypothetical protein
MEIENGSTSTVLTGVVDAATAVVQLEQTLGTPVPKLLVAATKLMEQVPKLGKCKLFLFREMMQRLLRLQFIESPFRTFNRFYYGANCSQ